MENITGREEEVLQAIERDPMISQQRLAQELGIARSSVASHIANLMKKGVILGKGYVVNRDAYVCVVGGANMDIQGKSYGKLILETSNPGAIEMSLGGVGRNIAHNLSNLGVNTYLITALGEDLYGQQIIAQCKNMGINMDHSLIEEGGSSGVYLALLDEQGEMALALAQMDIFEKLNVDFLKAKKSILEQAKVIVVDTNIPIESIEYIVDLGSKKNIPLFLDTVSIAKAEKVKNLIGKFHTIKPNLLEVELLIGKTIHRGAEFSKELREAGEALLGKGVKEVVISLGKEGAFYHNGNDFGFVPAFTLPVKNTTGAGDSFVAGLVFGTLEESPLEEKVTLAMGCGALTAGCEHTVNDELSVGGLLELIETRRK